MSKKAAEHHNKASEHHRHAAQHHEEAAKHHESGLTKRQLITHTPQADTRATLDIMLKKQERLMSKSMDTSST